MIALAREHSRPTLALLAIGAVVILLHQAVASRSDPCADPARLLHLDAYGRSYTVGDFLAPGDGIPQQRVDGTLPVPVRGLPPLAIRVLRAEEPFSFYNQTFRIVPPMPEDRTELRELRVGSDVLPVYRVFDDSLGGIQFTRYFVVLGVQPVRHLWARGIALAGQQLVHGTLPVTAFVVSGVAERETLPAVEGAAEAWLAAAWTEFRAVCRP